MFFCPWCDCAHDCRENKGCCCSLCRLRTERALSEIMGRVAFCGVCGKPFLRGRNPKKYCSRSCASTAYYASLSSYRLRQKRKNEKNKRVAAGRLAEEIRNINMKKAGLI